MDLKNNAIQLGHGMSFRNYVLSCTLWLALPVVIFLLTWIRPMIGVPVCLLLGYCIYKICVSFSNHDGLIINFDRPFWIGQICILLFLVLSGIGGYWYEEQWDLAFRNALFRDLVNNPWPVYLQISDDSQPILLCYYHLFWLPAALVSKFTHSVALGELFIFLYAYIGIDLMLIGVCKFINKSVLKLKYLAYIAMFCGWDIVTYVLIVWDGGSFADFVWHLKDRFFVFSAPTLPILTRFIYNSGIPAMLGILLILNIRDKSGLLVLVYSLLFFLAPIPSVGLFPLVVYFLLRKCRQSISVVNIIGVIIGMVAAAYFASNNNASNPMQTESMDAIRFIIYYAGCLIIFLLCTYGVYMPFIWKSLKHDTVFWILLITSSILPILSLNGSLDFGTRVSIPCIFYFMIYLLKALVDGEITGKVKRSIFVAVFIVGSLANICTYSRAFIGQYKSITMEGPRRALWLDSVFDKEKNECYNNFVATDHSFFTEYIMKRT